MKKRESEEHLTALLNQIGATNLPSIGAESGYVGPEGEHYYIPEKDVIYTYPVS